MNKRSYKRINKVALRSSIAICILIIIIGTCGYLSVPMKELDLVIFRSSKGVFNNDIAMTIGRFCIFIAGVFTYPIVFISYRISYSLLIFKVEDISNTQ